MAQLAYLSYPREDAGLLLLPDSAEACAVAESASKDPADRQVNGPSVMQCACECQKRREK
ncbi:hypothetical protein N7453_001508 [Penicillium expansum]|nr:hypothetical protein N7453_001508 [Penicillium expansum]